MNLFDPNVGSSAGFSKCGKYRYWLKRTWDSLLPTVTWIMLNPSKAGATQNDPTVRKCIKFSKDWHFGGLVVVNLYAYCATDPSNLPEVFPDAEMAANDAVILQMCEGRQVIAAWGADPRAVEREPAMMRLLSASRVACLKTTKDGHPWHPLYVAGDVRPMPFHFKEAA
jgi:hypothetical protein